MPKITGAEPAIVIRAEENHAKGHLRFALRAKPKVTRAIIGHCIIARCIIERMESAIQIQVNGENRETPAGTTVSTLLDQLGLNPGRVAIEYNQHILAKAKWGETKVAAGDRLEIVQFVGGG